MPIGLLSEDGALLLLEDGAGLLFESSSSLPADLGIAVVERIASIPALSAGFSGGVYRDKAERKPDGPQAVFRVASARPSFQSSGSRYLDVRLRFVVYAIDSEVAATLRADLEAAFEGRPAEYAAGWTTPWEVAGRSEDEVIKPSDDNLAFKSAVDFRFHESRPGG